MAGENARAAFDGVVGRRVSLAMTAVTINNSTVSILKPDGTTLVAVTGVSMSGGFIDAVTLPVAGTYTILVDPQGTVTGKMTLKLYDVPADAAASIVPGGAAVTVTTATPGQNAKLTFVGAANQRVFLKLSSVTIGSSTCCSTKVSILKPDGTTQVAPTSVGTSGGFIDTNTLPVAGTYTILVDPDWSNTGTVTVVLTVPVTGTITTADPPLAVTLQSGQVIRKTFTGTAGEWKTFAVSSVSSSLSAGCNSWDASITLAILNPNGTTDVRGEQREQQPFGGLQLLGRIDHARDS